MPWSSSRRRNSARWSPTSRRIITSVPLEKAISQLKLVDPEGELVKIAEGMGVSFGR